MIPASVSNSDAPASQDSRSRTSEPIDRDLLTAFLENIPDLVYFKDRAGRFIAVSNSKALRHGVMQPADMIGKSDFDFFSESHAQHTREEEERIIATGQPVIARMHKLTWADGRESWAKTTKLPLRNNRGEIVGTFGLSQDVTAAKALEAELDKTHRQLLDASRLAGMAEVATGVLHNVGNVLVSINVSTDVLGDTIRGSKAGNLAKVCALLREHRDDLAGFLAHDPKGRQVPAYLESLSTHLAEEQARLLQEIAALRKNVEHIKDIVSMQQSYAMVVGVVEALPPEDLVEDSLRMNSAALTRHDVQVVRDFKFTPPVVVERAKVLQILVNLIRNGKYALDEGGGTDKTLTLRIAHDGGEFVRIVVSDNGVGIPPENLTRIFSHGFTTRKEGHGFGLHSAALAAKEMGGSLTAHSDGPGQGATFILELPRAPAEPVIKNS